MTNNQLCNLIGAIGIAILSISMGLMLFGAMSAAWSAGAGTIISLVGLLNYE